MRVILYDYETEKIRGKVRKNLKKLEFMCNGVCLKVWKSLKK